MPTASSPIALRRLTTKIAPKTIDRLKGLGRARLDRAASAAKAAGDDVGREIKRAAAEAAITLPRTGNVMPELMAGIEKAIAGVRIADAHGRQMRQMINEISGRLSAVELTAAEAAIDIAALSAATGFGDEMGLLQQLEESGKVRLGTDSVPIDVVSLLLGWIMQKTQQFAFVPEGTTATLTDSTVYPEATFLRRETGTFVAANVKVGDAVEHDAAVTERVTVALSKGGAPNLTAGTAKAMTDAGFVLIGFVHQLAGDATVSTYVASTTPPSLSAGDVLHGIYERSTILRQVTHVTEANLASVPVLPGTKVHYRACHLASSLSLAGALTTVAGGYLASQKNLWGKVVTALAAVPVHNALSTKDVPSPIGATGLNLSNLLGGV